VRSLGVAVLVALAGCISDPSVTCDNGVTCPAGDTCTPAGCAHPADVKACMGLHDGDLCETDGACLGGACHPIECGDGIIDHGEVCDDGNTDAGDGCSADCKSNETCGNGVVDPTVHEQCDDGNTLSNDDCSSICALETPKWTDVTPRPIDARAGAMMAFLPKTRRTIIFGGYGPTTYFGDTWQSTDGKLWSKLFPITPPSPRASGVISNDLTPNGAVLFGGEGPSGLLGDTWRFNGVDWTELHPAHSPSPRAWSAVAFDTVRNRVVLFGGAGPQFQRLADTWEWDGADWTLIATTGSPPPDQGHAMTYDVQRDVVVMWNTHQEVWEYDGKSSTWTLRTFTTKPTSIGYSALAYDGLRRASILFGGYIVSNGANQTTSATYSWDGNDWKLETAGGAIPARAEAAMVQQLGFQGSSLVMFGGSTGNSVLADSWTYDGMNWAPSPILTTGPTPRNLVAAAYDTEFGVTLMFGGELQTGTPTGELWRWDGFSWGQASTSQGTVPSPRFASAMVYDTALHSAVLFGGATAGTALADTWLFGASGFVGTGATAGPSARQLHAMVYDSKRQRVILFGGATAQFAPLGETWAFDGTAWTRLAVANEPSGREGAGAAYDPRRDRVVVFGGFDGNSALADTWEFDGTTWTDVTPATSPPARAEAGMMWDPQRQRVVLYGGRSQVTFADTWEWDGAAWTPVATDADAPARSGIVMTYDNINRRAMWFGGRSLVMSLASDTWQLGYRSQAPEERCLLSTADDDGDGLAGCDDPDCWGRCTPDCPPATSCATGLPYCGDAQCAPIEDSLICPEDCQ
jgi:cysteine-rich repeat protein